MINKRRMIKKILIDFANRYHECLAIDATVGEWNPKRYNEIFDSALSEVLSALEMTKQDLEYSYRNIQLELPKGPRPRAPHLLSSYPIRVDQNKPSWMDIKHQEAEARRSKTGFPIRKPILLKILQDAELQSSKE